MAGTSPAMTEAGLESVKKTEQVASVGMGAGTLPVPVQQRRPDINPTAILYFNQIWICH
jgi:hypothetical protein